MIGVVADDITGSNDIGIMFGKSGYQAHIYSYRGTEMPGMGFSERQPEVLILNTDSRLDTPGEAYSKVFAATQELERMGVSHFINKTCSVFRGNIGAEFDAMLDALGEEFALVVLGFPKNGRQTIEGMHYVHGKPLAESEFRHDPIHPMTNSNLVEILSAQTRRSVQSLSYEVLERGVAELRAEIERMKPLCNYLIFDVRDQHDLAIIAQAVYDYRVICGSSALAEELPHVLGGNTAVVEEVGFAHDDNASMGILCAAGSLTPQTKEQVKYFMELGKPAFCLESLLLLEANSRREEKDRLVRELVAALKRGEDALVYSTNQPQQVEETVSRGLEMGYSKTEVSRLVSKTIAEIVKEVVEITANNRLLIAGGETSAAVCEQLGINGMRVLQEIQPGLPSCISLTEKPYLMVLKSGSFGQNNFFALAIEHLKGNF